MKIVCMMFTYVVEHDERVERVKSMTHASSSIDQQTLQLLVDKSSTVYLGKVNGKARHASNISSFVKIT